MQQNPESEKETAINPYLIEDEEISYTVTHNPTGMLASFLREIAGWGVTTWFVTDRRIIENKKQAGGFEYTDVQLPHVTSVAYTRELDWTALVSGVVLLVLGIVGSVLPAINIFGIIAVVLGLD